MYGTYLMATAWTEFFPLSIYRTIWSPLNLLKSIWRSWIYPQEVSEQSDMARSGQFLKRKWILRKSHWLELLFFWLDWFCTCVTFFKKLFHWNFLIVFRYKYYVLCDIHSSSYECTCKWTPNVVRYKLHMYW